jgi:hypothetical protein
VGVVPRLRLPVVHGLRPDPSATSQFIMEAPLQTLSSRPERSEVEGPAVPLNPKPMRGVSQSFTPEYRTPWVGVGRLLPDVESRAPGRYSSQY